ncbi:hypothetical protein V8F06_014054 [Rhypophila decipiens]
MGCANYHAWLVFQDDERWLARIPRDPFTDLPPDLIESRTSWSSLHLDHTLGPFSTAAHYFASVAQAYLDVLADSQLGQSDAGAACARQFYEAVRNNASIIAILSAELESFYLKHVDDKGDHLLVDEEYNIVGSLTGTLRV